MENHAMHMSYKERWWLIQRNLKTWFLTEETKTKQVSDLGKVISFPTSLSSLFKLFTSYWKVLNGLPLIRVRTDFFWGAVFGGGFWDLDQCIFSYVWIMWTLWIRETGWPVRLRLLCFLTCRSSPYTQYNFLKSSCIQKANEIIIKQT